MCQGVRAAVVLVACLAALPPRAFGQVDVSGEWGALFHEDLPHRGGMRLGDYTGLPLNEAGQRKAASWDEAMRSIPEWQCIPHVVTYAMRGPATIRFSKVVDVSQPFITSSHVKREPDGSKWMPAPCEAGATATR